MSRLRTFFLLTCILIFYPGNIVHSIGKFNFYYFFPDSVQSNFSMLTRGFYSFFDQEKVAGHFQAFTHEVDFQRLVEERKPDLVLVPAWYYERYGEKLGLKPLLTSLREGEHDYTKVLLIRKKDSFAGQGLEGKTVAVTNMGPDTAQQLDHYFKNKKLNFSKSNVIITPKDADAYYALALGQVDAAVVSKQTILDVSQTNPVLKKTTKEVVVSSPIPMPMICFTEGGMSKQRISELKQFFLQSGKQEQLPEFMRMLHISGWENGFL